MPRKSWGRGNAAEEESYDMKRRMALETAPAAAKRVKARREPVAPRRRSTPAKSRT